MRLDHLLSKENLNLLKIFIVYFSMCCLDILYIIKEVVNNFFNFFKISFGGLKWNRTIDLTLIRRAL